MTFDKDTAREIIRKAVIDALDDAALTIFDKPKGWEDRDLPRLFKALDEQLDVLSERHGHHLWEGVVGSAKYMAERAELKALGLPVVDDIALGDRR